MNQISNGFGFSFQAMVNKKEFYSPMFEDLHFKLKREEMELPANNRRGLIAHSEWMSWIKASKVANLTPHALWEWRKHPQAIAFVNESITLAWKNL